MHRAIRPIAVMLGFMFVVAAPSRASSVSYSDVEQTVVIGRNNSQPAIRLRTVTPQDVTVSGVTASDTNTTSNTPQTNPATVTTNTVPETNPVVAEPANIVPTAIIASQDGVNVQEIQVGDVTGTICDCGEILLPPIAEGGFPKYPLLALGVIPFLFLNRDGDRTPITFPPIPMPMPPTPETPIPEPATILLLGSGLAALGAGARRRRRTQAGKLDELNNATVAEEV